MASTHACTDSLTYLAVAEGKCEQQPLRAAILRREVGGAGVYCAHVEESSIAGLEHRVAPLDLVTIQGKGKVKG